MVSEDIAQDTFLAAWRSLATLRDPSRLRPWLCGIARNLAGKTNRHRRRETLVDADTLDHQTSTDLGPLENLVTRETEATVWTALSSLPDVYREPLVLFYREDQSVKEVALGLGITEETAKQRLSRGRKSLEQRLGDLVGQTLAAGRPSRAARAAAVASIVAAAAALPGTASAASTPSAIGSGWKLAVGLGVIATVAGLLLWLVVFPGRSEESAMATRPATSSVTSDPAALLGRLRAAHATWSATAKASAPCELRGSVRRTDGTAISGALVGVHEHSWHAGSLEPSLIQTDAGGAWAVAVPRAAAYTVSVSAPGQRAQTRRITCADATAGTTARSDTVVLSADGTALRGVLTDIGGGPIAGATLWVLDALAPASGTLFLARSDAAGAYELQLAEGPYTVLVIHPDYTFDVRPVSLGATTAREDFTLIPAASIDGTVRDATGQPVPGALVTTLAPARDAETPLRWKLSSAYGAMLPVTADARGTFRIRSRAPGTVRISARAGSSAAVEPTSVDLAFAEARTDVTVTVRPARSLVGFVAGDEKRGIAGVELLAFREDAPIAMPSRATSDGAGRFEIRGLGPGTYRVAASDAAYAPFVSDPITITDRDRDDVLVVLDHGVPVRGRIEPARRATILVEPALADRTVARTIIAAMLRADVADDGTFTLPSVPPGNYLVRARTHALEGASPVRVGASADVVAITLAPRPAIVGQVVDATGAPVARALVVADAAGPGDPATARTDDRGQFAMIGIRPGRAQLRVFDARGQRPWAGAGRRLFAARKVVVPASGAITERLEVASGGGRIEGVVVGPRQKPLADAWIEVRADRAHRLPPFHQPAPVLTDATGHFAIEGVFGANLIVEASGADGQLRGVAVHVTPGSKLRIELRPPVTLVATVQYQGAEVTDRLVVVSQPSTGFTRYIRTPGAIRIPSLIAGEYELTITSPAGYARRTVTIGSAATTTVDLVLSPWASVRGTLHGRDGQPWADASLMFDDLLPARPHGTGPDGRFAVDKIAAGAQTLQFIGSGGDLLSLDIELAPGQSLDLGVITARSDYDHQSTATASKDLGIEFSVESGELRIANVDPSGPAARAGLRRGDVVRKVGTLTIDDADAAMSSLATKWRSRGRDVEWTITRGGAELKLPVHVPL